MSSSLRGKRIILGVTGSIAAYKAVSLLRLLTQGGADVQVVMTEAASRFIAPLTFEVLSGHPLAQDLFAGHQDMKHLSISEEADLLLIAPCTANTLAKLSLGLADNLLGTMALTVRCPLMVCPAMDGDMWNHSTVQTHADTLKARGVMVVEPEIGTLASGQWGAGRLAEEGVILQNVLSVLGNRQDLRGERILISAGPTQEPIDAVRFISNGSSGKMGYALAEAASSRGAEVILVSGPTHLNAPPGMSPVFVKTAEDMLQALRARFEWSTTLIMTAAVGDFRPAKSLPYKMKKEQWDGAALPLERTPDILMALSAQRTRQRIIGFAAETDNLIEQARMKLRKKRLDMVVVNKVGGEQSAFGQDSNEVYLLTPSVEPRHIPRMPKRQLADVILDALLALPSPVAPSTGVRSASP